MLNSGNVYKYLDACSGRFYNCKKLLTYNRPWIFITGSRSIGKSTSVAVFFILDYLKNGHKFIYTRRTKDETLYTCRTFFGNAVTIINNCTEFNICEFKYDGGKYYIKMEGEEGVRECGCIIPLSQEQKHKSNNYSDFFNLVYDEFICEDSTAYLGSKATPDREYRAALSLYQTIDRGVDQPYRNETRFFFLGNTATIYNPIFLSLDITEYIDDKTKIVAPKSGRGSLVVLHRVEFVEATEDMENSFSYILSGEEERNYAFRNKGYDSGNEFIKKLPEIRSYIITLTLEGESYGVWTDREHDMYIGPPAKNEGRTISLDLKSHKESDLMLITHMAEFNIIQVMLERFKRGSLFYTNGKIRQKFYKYFKLMP